MMAQSRTRAEETGAGLAAEALVFESRGHPLIVAVQHPISLDDDLVQAAQGELLGRGGQATGFSGGYLLGVEDPTPYPAAQALIGLLHRSLVEPEEECWGVRFAFSFFKLHAGTPPASTEGWYYEGPHIDSHPALDGGLELLRVLVNLAKVPRRFSFLTADRFGLEQRGIPVTRTDFTPLAPPPGIPTQEVAIPPRTGDSLHVLRFWASVVAHVGLNDPEGSFLASFEAPCDFARTPIIAR